MFGVSIKDVKFLMEVVWGAIQGCGMMTLWGVS